MSDLICRDLCMTCHDETAGTKVEALKDINFQLKQGEILTVLGPSGCGKTTLLNMIAGFLMPTGGELTLGGVDIDGPGAERGMVFQQGALFEWLTVARNVDFGLRMRGEDGTVSSDKVDAGSTRWACRGSATRRPISCPAACSSVWRWRAAWSMTRR